MHKTKKMSCEIHVYISIVHIRTQYVIQKENIHEYVLSGLVKLII